MIYDIDKTYVFKTFRIASTRYRQLKEYDPFLICSFSLFIKRALTRPGRFDSKVHVLLPDVRGRKEILNLYLAKSPIAEGIYTNEMEISILDTYIIFISI